jgi:hypothetical protein
MTVFVELFRTARTEGLGVTLHIAEVRLFGRVPRFPQLQGLRNWHGADEGKFDGRDERVAKLRTRAAWTWDISGRGGERGRAGTSDVHRDLSYVQSLVRGSHLRFSVSSE